jgi:hypothetical protein
MGAYRCLNCGTHTQNPSLYEDGCHHGRGCGFRVGRFEYDPNFSIPAYPDPEPSAVKQSVPFRGETVADGCLPFLLITGALPIFLIYQNWRYLRASGFTGSATNTLFAASLPFLLVLCGWLALRRNK